MSSNSSATASYQDPDPEGSSSPSDDDKAKKDRQMTKKPEACLHCPTLPQASAKSHAEQVKRPPQRKIVPVAPPSTPMISEENKLIVDPEEEDADIDDEATDSDVSSWSSEGTPAFFHDNLDADCSPVPPEQAFFLDDDEICRQVEIAMHHVRKLRCFCTEPQVLALFVRWTIHNWATQGPFNGEAYLSAGSQDHQKQSTTHTSLKGQHDRAPPAPVCAAKLPSSKRDCDEPHVAGNPIRARKAVKLKGETDELTHKKGAMEMERCPDELHGMGEDMVVVKQDVDTMSDIAATRKRQAPEDCASGRKQVLSRRTTPKRAESVSLGHATAGSVIVKWCPKPGSPVNVVDWH